MERLRENYLISSQNSRVLTEQEVTQKNILPKLKESITFTTKEVIDDAIHLKESLQEKDKRVLDNILNKLKEVGIEDNSFKIWKIPIGRYGNKNSNNRVYPRELWENVRDKQTDAWKNLAGLCDHPEADNDPGKFRDQAVGWHGMDIGDDGIVYGYCSFVGPYGHLAQEMLEHGLKVGTSSSGFGDVDKITRTVDPNTYIIERLADLVLNPSQGTFGTIDCTHTAGNFMDDVHKSATIEFGKQPVRENIVRSKIMADKQMQYDAAAPNGGTDTAATGAAQSATPALNGENKTMRESMENTKVTLSPIEEKAFRKYVDVFLKEAGKIDNPLQRLNECVDILNCFEEGNCPDLRESIERKIIDEKENLEKIVENVISTEKDFGMDIKTFRESAERNTAQGILLNEQVSDYKELCEALQTRNKQLLEENSKLKKLDLIKEKLVEKKINTANKEIVNTSTVSDKLKETAESLNRKNEVLLEKISKLNLSNKKFEKENGVLITKIKEAANIMMDYKKINKLNESKKSNDNIEIKKLKETIAELKSINAEIENNYKNQSNRFDKLTESFENYKQEVADKYNPVAHMMPKASERVGKYLNLRENKGIEIENYWNDLLQKYGESVEPFEDKIRGAKTLKEATNSFLKHRTEIDPDFAVSQPAEFAYRNRTERAQLYEHQGIINPIDSYKEASVDQKNKDFLDALKSQGLQ